MIYCVIPQPLEAELYDRLTAYYKDDPNVKVIVDRRGGPDRRKDGGAGHDERRQVRDRRQPRVPGTFPPIEPPSSA